MIYFSIIKIDAAVSSLHILLLPQRPELMTQHFSGMRPIQRLFIFTVDIDLFHLRESGYGRPQQILFDKRYAELNFTVSDMRIAIPKIITSYDDWC